MQVTGTEAGDSGDRGQVVERKAIDSKGDSQVVHIQHGVELANY